MFFYHHLQEVLTIPLDVNQSVYTNTLYIPVVLSNEFFIWFHQYGLDINKNYLNINTNKLDIYTDLFLFKTPNETLPSFYSDTQNLSLRFSDIDLKLSSNTNHVFNDRPRDLFDEMCGVESNYGPTSHLIKDEAPINTTNIITHNGEDVDLTNMSYGELAYTCSNLDDLTEFCNTETVRSLYHYSVPDVKLFYPEPFIASPSFLHTDLVHLHILQYNYWLWFLFIFLIIFFFITFLCTVRWCNERTRPRRETRGVSRSKCGDLITACVPVTWAASIIVTESTDAMDYFDGFGTSEIVVGVRAYQWGWEYYYPKDLDLNYNIKSSYSTFIGNSLKYNHASDKTIDNRNMWKFYQNKTNDSIVTPAHLLLLPLDNNKMFNFMNFDNIGAAPFQEINAFKKIRTFSKVYNTNLIHTPLNFTNKYVQINSLFSNENNLNDSLNYGIKRQHNLLSTTALTNTYSTFLDKKSMDTFLNYNMGVNAEKNKTNIFNESWHTLKKENVSKTTLNTLNNIKLISDGQNNVTSKTLSSLVQNPTTLSTMNDDSDKKKFTHPTQKLFNTKLNNNLLMNSISNLEFAHNKSSSVDSNFDNISITSKFVTNKSPNVNFMPGEQSSRLYSKLTPTLSNYNLSLGYNTLDSNYNLSNNTEVASTLNSNYLSDKSNNVDSALFNKLASNRVFYTAPYAPIMSNNPYFSSLNYDTTNSETTRQSFINNKIITHTETTKGGAPHILKGKRDGALSTLSASYWNMFWSNTNSDLRVKAAIESSLKSDLSYIPLFTNFYDYDFRNAQALELLEDSFWETSYSAYSHYDYLAITDNFKKTIPLGAKASKRESFFYDNNIEFKSTTKPLTEGFNKDLSIVGGYYANNIQMDDLISPANLMNTKDFSIFPLVGSGTYLDETYLNSKNLNILFNNKANYVFNTNFNFITPQSYISTLNAFRADFEDFAFYNESLESINNENIVDILNTNNDSKLVADVLNVENNTQDNMNLTRVSNPVTLRSTARNSIVTYNALQKVFKARFEDGRANAKISHFGDLHNKQPFMTDGRVPYENLLGKNKESFYNTTFYKNKFYTQFNDLASLNNSLNYYFFDFPFLLAMKSDASRYMWFDWYAQWGMYEIQPSSVSRYSTLGVPYSRKHFDFNIESGERMEDTETYFTRISRSRKNYLPNWNYTPYLYARANVWNANTKFNDLFYNNNNSLNYLHTRYLLNDMNWYWTSYAFTDNTSNVFTPSHSGDSTYIKATWRPFTSISAYYYNVSNLIDILTKREYLYRQYFEINQKVVNLPQTLTSNPNNPLIAELRSSFLFIDPITYNSEYSRELYYNSLSFFKYLLFKDLILNTNDVLNKLPCNLNLINNYLFYYFFNTPGSNNMGNNNELYKNQYRPVRKGISNMLRIQATGAVAMPTEIRLQVLASSRDVIHSWAIPSAGVKIDCVPGYTSHRIMIFLLSGIYWGQCQEICGRYHHWMPIIVYFMKRDLFFLWCSHFVFNGNGNEMFDINDRQYMDYIRFASYDKNTWLTELSQNL